MADLPVLWATETTSDKDRKRLLRTLVADVTITPSDVDSTQLTVGLRWNPEPAASLRSPGAATPSSCAAPIPPPERRPAGHDPQGSGDGTGLAPMGAPIRWRG